MYKIISYYRSDPSYYPGNARIIQITLHEYALYIQHEVVGIVLYRKGRLPELEKVLFSFIPYGHSHPILWKKVPVNVN